MKKICILTNRNNIADSILNNFQNYDITISSDITNNEIKTNIDLYIVIDYEKEIPQNIFKTKVIKIHPSLLPSFTQKSAIKDAYLAGVKVTGVTICELNSDNSFGRIITQYPILIDNFTHYDQLKEEIEELEIKLLQPVVKSILENKLFDIVDFLNDTPTHNCNGCGGSCNNCNKCN